MTTVLSAARDPRVRAVVDFIQADPSRGWDVSSLARGVGLSPSGLRLVFKRDMGESPLKYLRRVRLERARSLLCSSHMSVKEIMVAVGCHDASHFVRDFERAYELSPARYRRRARAPQAADR